MIYKNKLSLLASLLSMSCACFASAAGTDVSYDYVEFRYVDAEISGLDGDGFQISGSYAVQGNWFVQGSFSTLGFDFDVDVTQFDVGGGYVWPQAQNYDLYALGSIVRATVDTSLGDDSETGFRVGGGVRSRITSKFEGRAELNYVDAGDSDTFVRLAGDYYFNDQFAAGLSIDLGGDADSFSIGGRYFFGERRVR